MTSFTVGSGARRIVSLTEEPTELLYLLGEEDRVVGITAYTERPPEAKRDKPVVSAFVGGSVERIRALEPDLVIGFSDVQADYARTLIHAGLPVLILNQRSLQDILDAMVIIGGVVGAAERARVLMEGYARRLEEAAERTAKRARLPRVYFEEWDDPMISCIRWVGELIELAGGENIFADRSLAAASKGRHVTVEDVRAANPEIILASWCGKPFDREAAEQRLGSDLDAFRAGRVHELPAEIILQPGPAALGDGLALLETLIGASPTG